MMLKNIFKRLILIIPMIFLIASFVFVVMRILPGDITHIILGEQALPEAYEQLRQEMGLNEPLIIQYGQFLRDSVQGNLGFSLQNGIPVSSLLMRALPYTIDLTIGALIVGIVFGIPLGVMSALKRNSSLDFVGRIVALAGISAPPFFIGILLLLIFSYRLNLFPLFGGGDLSNIPSRLHHLMLPSIALGLGLTATVMRMTRSSMLEVIRDDYIRTARAKGLSEGIVIFKHALKNALIPVVTVIGTSIGRILGGAVLIEIVFTRPGMGKLLVDAINGRDYPVVQATVIMFAFWVMLTNLVVDMVYTKLNARIKL